MPGRHGNDGSNYRYGFQGQEKDDEVKGDGNSIDFGGRSIYDGRVARFISIDPRWRDFTSMSPYAFAANNPIIFIDENGEGPILKIQSKEYSRKIKAAIDAGDKEEAWRLVNEAIEAKLSSGGTNWLVKKRDEGNLHTTYNHDKGGANVVQRTGYRDDNVVYLTLTLEDDKTKVWSELKETITFNDQSRFDKPTHDGSNGIITPKSSYDPSNFMFGGHDGALTASWTRKEVVAGTKVLFAIVTLGYSAGALVAMEGVNVIAVADFVFSVDGLIGAAGEASGKFDNPIKMGFVEIGGENGALLYDGINLLVDVRGKIKGMVDLSESKGLKEAIENSIANQHANAEVILDFQEIYEYYLSAKNKKKDSILDSPRGE